jgi:3-deoxy-D-manno-octulosonic-acid transferase
MYTTLRSTIPGLKMIIAPRHFHWQTTLLEKVTATGAKTYTWTPTNPLPTKTGGSLIQQFEGTLTTYDIVLVCVLGHLFKLYPIATLFFLGGTFVPIGGHNLLESAAWEIPSIIGPYYYNSKSIADQLAATGGLYKVTTQQELNFITEKLLTHPQLLHAAKLANNKWISKELKSTTKNIDLLTKKLT